MLIEIQYKVGASSRPKVNLVFGGSGWFFSCFHFFTEMLSSGAMRIPEFWKCCRQERCEFLSFGNVVVRSDANS